MSPQSSLPEPRGDSTRGEPIPLRASPQTCTAPRLATWKQPIGLKLNPDGSLVQLEAGSWFVCFVPAIDQQWWHRFVHKVHKHVFALRPEHDGYWTLFEPWWTRLLTATITTNQAEKFLIWGGQGDVLLVREAIPGHSSQLRGWMTCAALAAHLLGRRYYLWTPHQLFRRLSREPNVCAGDVTALLQRDLSRLGDADSRVVEACAECRDGAPRRRHGAAKPFCMNCGRDLHPGVLYMSDYRHRNREPRSRRDGWWKTRLHFPSHRTGDSDEMEHSDRDVSQADRSESEADPLAGADDCCGVGQDERVETASDQP